MVSPGSWGGGGGGGGGGGSHCREQMKDQFVLRLW